MARSAGAAGEPDRALELLDEARNAYREAGRPTGEAACLMARIRWADDSETDQNIQDALKIYQEAGSTRNEAACHNAMGEAARRAGALHRAEAEYRRAISLYEALGTGGMAALVPQVNLAMVHACRGDGESARTLASACRNEATRLHRPKVIAIANSVLMLASELLDEATEWEVALAGLSRALRQLPRPNKDIASTLLTAAQLAQAAEAPQRAQLAAELARSQFEALGDEAGHDAALRLYDETET